MVSGILLCPGWSHCGGKNLRCLVFLEVFNFSNLKFNFTEFQKSWWYLEFCCDRDGRILAVRICAVLCFLKFVFFNFEVQFYPNWKIVIVSGILLHLGRSHFGSENLRCLVEEAVTDLRRCEPTARPSLYTLTPDRPPLAAFTGNCPMTIWILKWNGIPHLSNSRDPPGPLGRLPLNYFVSSLFRKLVHPLATFWTL